VKINFKLHQDPEVPSQLIPNELPEGIPVVSPWRVKRGFGDSLGTPQGVDEYELCLCRNSPFEFSEKIESLKNFPGSP